MVRSSPQLPAELLELAAGQQSAVTGAQLRSAMGERAIRRAAAHGTLLKLWQGAYAVRPAGPSDEALPAVAAGSASASRRTRCADAARVPTLTRLAAARLTLDRPVTACLDTAAELYEFATEPDFRTHILGDTRSTHRALVVHRTPQIRPGRQLAGFGLVDPAETAVRLAGHAPNPPRALAVLDACLRSRYATQDSLDAAATLLHIDRIGEVRALIPFADPRAESPPESWLRWVCHDAGLPRPEPQFWVTCASGARFRLDLAWPALRVALEYDGVDFHTGSALTADRARRNALTAEGWTVLSVTAPMLWSGRAALVELIRDGLRRAELSRPSWGEESRG